MKSLGLFAAVIIASGFVSTGCEQAKSKLDESPKAPPGAVVDSSGTLEQRVARLETENAKYREVLEVVRQAYDQQKGAGGQAGQRRQRPGQPDPNAVFAVDVTPDLQGGQSEGPNDALVTVVEAWDFG